MPRKRTHLGRYLRKKRKRQSYQEIEDDVSEPSEKATTMNEFYYNAFDYNLSDPDDDGVDKTNSNVGCTIDWDFQPGESLVKLGAMYSREDNQDHVKEFRKKFKHYLKTHDEKNAKQHDSDLSNDEFRDDEFNDDGFDNGDTGVKDDVGDFNDVGLDMYEDGHVQVKSELVEFDVDFNVDDDVKDDVEACLSDDVKQEDENDVVSAPSESKIILKLSRKKIRKQIRDEKKKAKQKLRAKSICDVCGIGFHPSALQRHKTVHEDKLDEPTERKKDDCQRDCNICGAHYSRPHDLIIHKKSHASGETLKKKVCNYKCDQCKKKYQFEKSLLDHKGLRHGEKLYSCAKCNEEFATDRLLKKHIRTLRHHTLVDPDPDIRQCICEICNKIFPYKSGLDRHMTVHTGIKAFQCSICGVSYAFQSDLVKHTRVHTGEKPHRCSECPESFFHKKQLRRHMYNQHKVFLAVTGRKHGNKGGVKPEKPGPWFKSCIICKRRDFISNSQLRKHKLEAHDVNVSVKCNECNKYFVSKYSLNEHMRRHLNLKNFLCDFCSKAFIRKTDLTLHRRTHTNEKPYACAECGRRYSDRSNLNKHVIIHKKLAQPQMPQLPQMSQLPQMPPPHVLAPLTF